MTVGAVVTLTGSFQRWLITGSVGRSSYELLGLVLRLGFAPDGLVRLMVQSWPLMPLLLTAGVVAVWWGWRRAGAVLGGLAGLYAAAVGGIIALASPDGRTVQISNAPATTAIGAAIVLIGCVLAVTVRASRDDPLEPVAVPPAAVPPS